MKKRSFFIFASPKVFSLGNEKGIFAFILHSPRLFVSLLSVCLLGFPGQADAQSKASCFKMQSAGSEKVVSVEKTFRDSKDDNVLRLFDAVDEAYGLSVTMDVTRLTENYLVRLLLEDAEGRKHLVAESYKEISPAEKSFQLTGYCEETALLDGVKPIAMHVIADNAEVVLHIISMDTEDRGNQVKGSEEFQKKITTLHEQQIREKVNQINAYNEANNKLWRAGVTKLSLKKYEDKMRVLGFNDDDNIGGFEFYVGGIFEISGTGIINKQSNNRDVSSFIDHFDWRNRHGINWMTPVKDQGRSGYCAAFTAVSCVEALFNLYYNQKIDLDLSEQEAACCNGTLKPYSGMTYTAPLNYFKNYGVCDETAYPFIDDSLQQNCRSGEITPSEVVRISNYSYKSKTNVDSIKSAIMHCGPLVSGFNVKPSGYSNDMGHHAMALIGFGTIHVGDTIHEMIHFGSDNHIGWGILPVAIIPEGDPRIGMTYWIYKNSYDNGDPNNTPYYYMLYDDLAHMDGLYRIIAPFNSMHYDDSDVICEDADGDGFYFWGIGTKPASAPANVPDQPDGDDSDPLLGEMDWYGFCEDLNPETRPIDIISTMQITSESKRQYSHIEVTNNSTWTVNHDITFYNGAKITIKNGCTLILGNGAILENVEIIMESGAFLKIMGNSKVHLRSGVGFSPPVGAIVEIESGEIL